MEFVLFVGSESIFKDYSVTFTYGYAYLLDNASHECHLAGRYTQ
jgi:hypothetical protein